MTISMTTIKHSIVAIAISILAIGAIQAQSGTTANKSDAKIEKKRAEIRKMAADTLDRLYKAQPQAKGAVEKAVGYAVFSNRGVKLLLSGSGKGQGIVVSNRTGKEVYMKMFELQVGPGVGVKKFKVIFVFQTEKAFNNFADAGLDLGAQMSAAAKPSDSKGASIAGAASVADGVWMYQLTDKGLALEITAKGTKYFKDKELNP
jgi:lipid-binding SYLF domain-containing protein